MSTVEPAWSSDMTFKMSVTLRPDDDLVGIWVAHCLDLDIVTQGENIYDVLESVFDCVADTFFEDRSVGLVRSPAPEPFWDEFECLIPLGIIRGSRGLENFVLEVRCGSSQDPCNNACTFSQEI